MAPTRRRRMPAAQRREVILVAAEETFAAAATTGPRWTTSRTRRRVEGADLRALRVQARTARLAPRRAGGRDLPPPRGRRRARRDRARSACATASTRSCASSRSAARRGGRCSATPPTPRSRADHRVQAQATGVIARLIAADPDAPADLGPVPTDRATRIEIHAQMLSGAVQSLATWWHDHRDDPARGARRPRDGVLLARRGAGRGGPGVRGRRPRRPGAAAPGGRARRAARRRRSARPPL